MTDRVLTTRALNRATLARQLLLRRVDLPVYDAVDHLVGLQAQIPQNPYVGLWSRLERFQPATLEQLLLDRRVVRIACMRSTLHLVIDDDALVLRRLSQPVLDAELGRVGQVELDEIVPLAGELLDGRALAVPQLRSELAARFPDVDTAALAFAMRNRLALVQVPPRGLWSRSGQVAVTTAESWLDRTLDGEPPIDEVVVRYLAAFGPATVADVAAWSRLTGLREVLERLRPRLCTFRDERGRELFDVPGAPLPDPETPAPVRFLPEYDNVLLSHADRSRVMPELEKARLWSADRRGLGAVLHDGFLVGLWRNEIDSSRGRVTVVVEHARPLSRRVAASVTAEARRLLRFTHPEAEHDIRLSRQT